MITNPEIIVDNTAQAILAELKSRYKRGREPQSESRKIFLNWLNRDNNLLVVIKLSGLTGDQILGFYDVNRRPIPYNNS